MTPFWWSILTACIWGTVPLLEKLGLFRADPITGVFARSFGVAIGALVFAVWWSPWKALAALDARTLCLLGFGGFLASFVGQMAFYHALKVGHVSQVTPISGTYPLIAALLAWTVLREPLTLSRLIGVSLIVAGTLLLHR